LDHYEGKNRPPREKKTEKVCGKRKSSVKARKVVSRWKGRAAEGEGGAYWRKLDPREKKKIYQGGASYLRGRKRLREKAVESLGAQIERE